MENDIQQLIKEKVDEFNVIYTDAIKLKDHLVSSITISGYGTYRDPIKVNRILAEKKQQIIELMNKIRR